ncbi:MAG: hypothetical protein KDN19_17455 [Verrucomicrobiae bacterium]|nr:hypothetical protein [Verrucomicrobiae bacterium]
MKPALFLALVVGALALPLNVSAEAAVPRGITVVAKDFVIEVYHNGDRLPENRRKLLLDRFGATAERIDADLKPGDWIVFHLANNRLRHHGTKYFAMAAPVDDQPFGYVSDFNSPQWSSCDDPGRAKAFIENRFEGTESRAVPIGRPWEEGAKFVKEYAGEGFPCTPVWGAAPSTWLKFVVPGEPGKKPSKRKGSRKTSEPKRVPPGTIIALAEPTKESSAPPSSSEAETKKTEIKVLPIESPRRWPVQIISAIYGTGGKNADVTARVSEYVEGRKFFAANPKYLGADPNPYWNKGLHIVYLKDGVRREQRRNENEHILPESFYGPQDAGELESWLTGTRWIGPKGEIQFHPNRLATGPKMKTDAQWETTASNRLRLTWDQETATEFQFDYVWSSFKEPRDGKNTYQLLK